MDITIAYFIIHFLINLNNVNGQDTSISKEVNYKSTDICNIRSFESETSLIVRRCDEFYDGSHVCLVSDDGGRLYEYTCVNELWKLSPGTDVDNHGRQKRFIDGIIGAVIGLVVVAVAILIYCSASGECVEKKVDIEEVYSNPPKYTFCPESGTTYTALSREKSAIVTWDEPIVEDDEKVVRENQTFHSGNEFEGSPNGLMHTVTYTAIDGYDLKATCSFSFIVKYITCDTRDPPRYGKHNCSHGYIYGSECIAKCYDGYEIVGRDTATCQQDKTWDNTPVCKKVNCPRPFSINNGEVMCEDNLYPFQTVCIFECDDGFKRNGPVRMECQADRTWSVEDTIVTCTDNEAPSIDCLSPQIFYADRGGFTTSVTWELPSATDNFDPDPVVTKLSNISQGDILQEGNHYVIYEASDDEGNTLPALSKCTITLEVKVIRCFVGPTDALDRPRFIQYNCSDTRYYVGVYCDLGCELNIQFNGSNRMSCERNGTTANGVWVLDSDVQPSCEVATCPPLEPPEYGAFTTDSVNARPLHVMLCKEGYDVPDVGPAFQGRLSCQDSGEWYPLSAFPDCIVQELPWTRLPAELIYTGNCNDNNTQEIIKQQVLEYLAGVIEDVDKSICPDQETCKIENLVIVCGVNSKRRRRGQPDHIINTRQDRYIVVEFDIMVVFDAGNKTAENAYLDIQEFYENITELITENVNEGKFDIQNLTLSADSFKPDDSPEFVCTDSGYKFQFGSLKCKPCPRGRYLNSTTDQCEFCNIGEYMDHEAAITCDLCPNGYSTMNEGSKNVTSCLKLCSPGSVSSTSMEPCYACPIGTYQPSPGQTKCMSCPNGTSTRETNSIVAEECEVFDIFIGTLDEQSVIGIFNAEDSAILTLSLWLRPVKLENFRISLYITEIINLTFSDNVYVAFGSSFYNTSDGKLASEQWTYVVCSFDTISGNVQLHVGGRLIMNETETVIDPSRKISKGTIEMENISKGVYISGFILHNRHIDQAGVTPLTQVCAATETDGGVFSMTDILPYLVQGSSILLPTTCDPVNECETGACRSHTCINKVNGFECICHNEMTGPLCNIPPDHCLDNQCVNGDCLSANGTYECTCKGGFTGTFCDKPPVNGGWSEWQEWNSCSETCGGGTRDRSRECNNPLPGFMGLECEGNMTETEGCNNHKCPSCPKLKREYGTIVTCKNDSSGYNLECNMTCVKGKVLTNGQRPYEKYNCGPINGYIWEPTEKLPACVDVEVPDRLGTQVSIRYTDTIAVADADDVVSSVEQNFNDLQCETCLLKTTIVSTNVSNNLSKRSSSSTLTLQFSRKLTGDGDIALADFLTDGTETPAMTELLQTLRSMVAFTEMIQTNSTSIFDVNVDGVEYITDNSSISFAGTVTCAEGYAGADGLCAQCAAGTRLKFPDCVSCDIGTYQPLKGQNECLQCPDGYITTTFGATSISECSVITQTSTSTYSSTINTVTSTDDKKKDDQTVIIVVVIVACVVSISVIIIIVLIIRNRRNRSTANNFTSISMGPTVSGAPIVPENTETNVITNNSPRSGQFTNAMYVDGRQNR